MGLPTARKWRPQSFDEVVGQDETVKALKSAISIGKIGQAYLFSGPRGVGKTTLARILAKSLNCVNGPTPTPCGKCENCLEIKEGTSIDVVEIDGASNRKIDDVRNIREAVKFVPVKSRYKVYIIDEVHMLTDEAFNALLKTLEEPPPHTIFIFATTEPYKVKSTIRSRCQHFILKPLTVDLIFKQLKKISEAEGYKIPDSILVKIAKAGNGSMRDSESIFDMVISYVGENIYSPQSFQNIDGEEISKLLGVIDTSHLQEIVDYISKKELSKLLRKINDLSSKGFDLKKLVEELITFFRNVLIAKEFGIDKSLIKALDEEIKIIEAYKDSFQKEDIVFIQNTLIRTYQEMKTSINELFHLENSMFRIVNPDNVITLSKLLEDVRKIRDLIKSNFIHQQNTEMANTSGIVDPVDALMEEIDTTLPTEELIKQIIAENSFAGVEKKIKLELSENILKIKTNSIVKDMLEKDIEKIKQKLKSAIGIQDVIIDAQQTDQKLSSSSTQKQTQKPQNNTLENMVLSFFNAEEVKVFSQEQKPKYPKNNKTKGS
ncbi:MAG: DNA polymerase III subunit gamma/tau [Brevinematales bacterium]|nr:DNA polymerase III subunit gamma/tau [Brevinematales bacterium]